MATRQKVSDWLDDEYSKTKLRGWVRRGLTNEELAEKMGISVATLYNWKKSNVEFLEVLKEDRDFCDDNVENALYRAALDGNVTAQIFYLKNRRRKDWKDKQDVEVSGEVGIVDAMIKKANERKERLENDS